MGFASQPRALQEYTRIIPAGGVQTVPAVGEFLFVTEAVVEFKATLGGKSFKLQEGDHIRVEEFRDVELHNLSSSNALTVTVVIGYGEFDRRVVNGTVTMLPGVLRADGSYEADTRQELALYVHPTYAQNALSAQGDMGVLRNINDEYTGVSDEIKSACWDERNKVLYVLDYDGLQFTIVRKYDQYANFLGSDSFPQVGHGATTGQQIQAKQIAARDGYLYVATRDGSNEVNDGSIWRCPALMIASPLGWSKWYERAGNWPGDSPASYVDHGLEITASGTIVGGDLSEDIYEVDPDTDETLRVLNTGYSGTQWTFTIGLAGEPVILWADKVRHHEWGTSGVVSGYDLNTNINMAAAPMFIAGALIVAAFEWSPSEYKLYRVKQTDDGVILTGLALPVADRQCACLAKLLKRNVQPMAETSGDIAIAREDGRMRVSGEVIKMALEWYGGPVPSDYLDHVFFISADGVQKGGGQNSFKRLGIEDDFALDLPGVVRLTVDNDLL